MISIMRVAKRISGVLLTVLLVVAAGLVLFRSRDIRDWWVLRSYVPSERVAQISAKTTMTSYAKNLFYVYDPQIEPATEFNANCTIAEASIVLGCYNGSGIFVFDVTDPRLAGVHDVTAAHEMLHAAYDRLSQTERTRVDALTKHEYSKLTDERLLAVVAAYRQRDPQVVPNELHSILATEVRSLDPELEAYYKKYFTDRLAVVALSEAYEHVFTENIERVNKYDTELAILKVKIESIEASLGSRAKQIAIDKAQLDQLKRSNNVSDYNAMVPGYNQSVNTYNSDLTTYKSLIDEYNKKVADRNAITVEQNNLVKSLDSKAQAL